jgi:hypothetical protein
MANVLKVVAFLTASGVMVGGCALGSDGDRLSMEASLAGVEVETSGPRHPIVLHHEEITELTLTIANRSPDPVEVAHVRLEGEMLGLIFLTYDTGIDETIAPGEKRIISFPIDFFDLRGQAHGLLRGRLRLFDADRRPLAAQELVVDGRGSPLATMAVFNLVLLGAAVASFLWNLYHLARRTLPAHRFVRALRFATTGTGFGLGIAAAFSTLRIWPLGAVTWVPLVAAFALGGLVVGYVSPGGRDELGELIDDLAEIDLTTGTTPLPMTAGTGPEPGTRSVLGAGADPVFGARSAPGARSVLGTGTGAGADPVFGARSAPGARSVLGTGADPVFGARSVPGARSATGNVGAGGADGDDAGSAAGQ